MSRISSAVLSALCVLILTACGNSNLILPENYGLYAVSKGKLVNLEKVENVPDFARDCQFIYFDKGIQSGMYDRLTLYQLNFEPPPEKPKSGDFWEDYLSNVNEQTAAMGNMLDGIPNNGTKLDVNAQPVKDQPEMIRMIPETPLDAGVYQYGNYKFTVEFSKFVSKYRTAALQAKEKQNWKEAVRQAKTVLALVGADAEMDSIVKDAPFIAVSKVAEAAFSAERWEEATKACLQALKLRPGDAGMTTLSQRIPRIALQETEGDIKGIVFSKDAKQVIGLFSDGSGTTWDTSTGEGIERTRWGSLNNLTFSSDGVAAVLNGSDADVRVVTFQGRSSLRLHDRDTRAAVTCMTIDNTGENVVLAGTWTRKELLGFGATLPSESSQVSQNNERVSGITVWNINEKTLTGFVPETKPPIVTFLNGKYLFAKILPEENIQILDSKTLSAVATINLKCGPTSFALSTATGRSIYLVGEKSLGMVDLEKAEIRQFKANITKPIQCIGICRNADVFAFSCGDNVTNVIQNPPDGDVTYSIKEADGAAVRAIAFSPDATIIAVGIQKGRVALWNIEKLGRLYVEKGLNKEQDFLTKAASEPPTPFPAQQSKEATKKLTNSSSPTTSDEQTNKGNSVVQPAETLSQEQPNKVQDAIPPSESQTKVEDNPNSGTGPSSVDTKSREQVLNAKTTFRGSIDGRLAIHMQLKREGNVLTGAYFYDKYKQDIPLKGSIDEQNNVELTEYEKGKEIGLFSGKFTSPNKIEGHWSKPDGSKKLTFVVELEK